MQDVTKVNYIKDYSKLIKLIYFNLDCAVVKSAIKKKRQVAK